MEDRFNLQKDKLRKHELEIAVIWECEWKTFVERAEAKELRSAGAKLYRRLLEKDIMARPKSRLIPREALRGGRVDAINLFWSKPYDPKHTLEYLDYNSL